MCPRGAYSRVLGEVRARQGPVASEACCSTRPSLPRGRTSHRGGGWRSRSNGTTWLRIACTWPGSARCTTRRTTSRNWKTRWAARETSPGCPRHHCHRLPILRYCCLLRRVGTGVGGDRGRLGAHGGQDRLCLLRHGARRATSRRCDRPRRAKESHSVLLPNPSSKSRPRPLSLIPCLSCLPLPRVWPREFNEARREAERARRELMIHRQAVG